MLKKLSIAQKGTLHLYYSFENTRFEISDKGIVIAFAPRTDVIASQHGFTDNTKHPTSPFLPPQLRVKTHGN